MLWYVINFTYTGCPNKRLPIFKWLSTGFSLSEIFCITAVTNCYLVTACCSTAAVLMLWQWTDHQLAGSSCRFLEGIFCSQTLSYKSGLNPGVLLPCEQTNCLVYSSLTSNNLQIGKRRRRSFSKKNNGEPAGNVSSVLENLELRNLIVLCVAGLISRSCLPKFLNWFW